MTGSLFFGLKGGQAMVKMMLDADDDYFSTPNTDYAKFAFNSETTLIAYVDRYEKITWGGPTPFPRVSFPGTTYNAGNGWYVRVSTGANTDLEHWFFDGLGAAGGDFIPIVESKPIIKSGGDAGKVLNHILYRKQDARFSFGLTRSDYDVCMQNSFGMAGPVTAITRPATNLAVKFQSGSATMRLTPLNTGNSTTWTSVYDADSVVAVWDLPMDETALTVPTGPDTGEILRIISTPSLFRMSRDGYDASDASGRELLLDGSRNPAKVIATGEVTIAAGSTADAMIPVDLQPLSDITFVDTNVRLSSDPFYLPGRITTAAVFTSPGFIGLTYRSLTDRVRFYNELAVSLTVRYVVYALDDRPPSDIGTNDVIRTSEDAIQILRPGASNPPRFSEIILDSRMSYLPIVAEGFIPRSSFGATDNSDIGNTMARIDFTNTGFTPFLKYAVKFQFNASDPGSYYLPIIWRFVSTPDAGFNGVHSAYSTTARIETDHIKFYANFGNPTAAFWGGNSTGTAAEYQTTYAASGYGVMGIRYYIFAIPNAL